MNALQYIYDRQNTGSFDRANALFERPHNGHTRELKYIYIRTDPAICM